MDGYTFAATVAGVHVAFQVSGPVILRWSHGIPLDGHMRPVKETARRLARPHLRRHGAKPGESWIVRFADTVECRRV